jgi:hypothetical protein
MLVKEASSFLNIGTQLSDVVYSDDEQRYEQEFDSELEAIEAFLRDSFIMRVQNPDIEPDTGLFLTSFIRCLACFKHRAFKEEKEVRLGACPFSRSTDLFLEDSVSASAHSE